MKMIEIKYTKIKDLLLIKLETYKDQRGIFFEIYQHEKYKNIGIKDNLIQDNFSRSKKGVLRGLHYTYENPQSQLMTLLNGEIFDVIVDLRKNSKTFGEWCSFHINENDDFRQIYMPPGVAHGFYSFCDSTELNYKVSENYNKNDERGLFWADSNLKISWPNFNPVISQKDSQFPVFNEVIKKDLPKIN